MRDTLISSRLGDDIDDDDELAVVSRPKGSVASCFSIGLTGFSTSSVIFEADDGHLSGLASRSSACIRRSSSFMLCHGWSQPCDGSVVVCFEVEYLQI